MSPDDLARIVSDAVAKATADLEGRVAALEFDNAELKPQIWKARLERHMEEKDE